VLANGATGSDLHSGMILNNREFPRANDPLERIVHKQGRWARIVLDMNMHEHWLKRRNHLLGTAKRAGKRGAFLGEDRHRRKKKREEAQKRERNASGRAHGEPFLLQQLKPEIWLEYTISLGYTFQNKRKDSSYNAYQ
jgi:hypothetical protein